MRETPEAALQEFLARSRRMKLPDHKSLPMVMAGVKVKVARLLDLTDAEVAVIIKPYLGREKFTGGPFKTGVKPSPQAIGRAAKEICFFSGLLAPSQVMPGSRNIAHFFPRNWAPEKL